MAWLPDEIHEFYEDCKDKKSTAQSARHARSHCGKGGRVKFASDYMTKKEREAMNGECKSYRMNDPISWKEFKTWPSEHQITYIKLLRAKYNAPDKYIAEMMGISRPCLCNLVVDLGLGTGKSHGAANKKNIWDKEGFYAWWHGAKGDVVKSSETPVEEEEQDEEFNYIPMTWKEFKVLTDNQKIEYINALRKKFNATNPAIAEMLGIDRTHFVKAVVTPLGLMTSKPGGPRAWDKFSFAAWVNSRGIEEMDSVVEEDAAESLTEATDELVAVNEEPEIVCVSLEEELGKEKAEAVEELLSEVVKVITDDTCDREKMIRDAGPIAFTGNSVPVIPSRGTLTFDNNAADDALATIKTLLGNMRVSMTITWFPAE